MWGSLLLPPIIFTSMCYWFTFCKVNANSNSSGPNKIPLTLYSNINICQVTSKTYAYQTYVKSLKTWCLPNFFTAVATVPFHLCYQDCIYPYTPTCIAILDHSFIRTELCMLLAFSSAIAITNTTDLELLRNIYSWKSCLDSNKHAYPHYALLLHYT